MKRFPSNDVIRTEDDQYMIEALKEAWQAFDRDEVPVGSVIVFDRRIVARGYNQVELLQDATAHAELLAIGAASQFFSNWRLEGATLYTTLEPCPMCLGAIFLSRISRLVWGASDMRHGACGSFVNLLSVPHPTHQLDAVGDILSAWCAQPLQRFFQQRRVQNQET